MVAPACNLSIKTAEARGAKVQGHLWLVIELHEQVSKTNFKNLSKRGKESSTLGT